MATDDPIMVSFLEHRIELLQAVCREVTFTKVRFAKACLFICEQWPLDIGFNRAYGVDVANLDHLTAMVQQFTMRGIRPLLEIGCELIDDRARTELSRLSLTHQWDVVELSRTIVSEPRIPPPALAIQRVDPHQAHAYAELAVEAYEFIPSLRHVQRIIWERLCVDPEAHCLFVELDGVRCAVAVLNTIDRWGIFSGAATLPAFRNRGCQSALLAYRIHLAQQIGLQSLYVRTMANSNSQRNLERADLKPVRKIEVWGFPRA
jgi:hypothetical protein